MEYIIVVPNIIFVDVRLQNLEVRVSHLEYRLHCIEAADKNNTALAWPNYCAMGSQMAPTFYPSILQANNNQMASTSPTYMPLSAGVDSNIGVPSPVGIISTATVPLSVTPPLSLAPSQPFLAEGNSNINYLTSSAIPSHQLRNIDDVISQHRNLLHEESAGTLCQILAKEAIFGKDLLARCTVTGKGGTLALPLQEMNDLKRKMFSLFPRFHPSPEQFEPVWKKCTTAIEQACGRLRRERQKRGN